MKNNTRWSVIIATALLLMASLSVKAQEAGLFDATNALRDQANEVSASLLSPRNYADGEKYYARAREQVDRGRTDRAQRELDRADEAFNASIEAARLAEVNFETTLKARDLAVEAEAAKYEPELWTKAEEDFNRAARTLEGGNVNRASSRAEDATESYDEAELAAIKTAIVGRARELIAAAEDDRAERGAPISMATARDAMASAEAKLEADRYATEDPIKLAEIAEYEAEHARFIADQSRRDISTEQLILEWEEPLKNTASALDVTTDMRNGYEKTANASVSMATYLREENTLLSQRVEELERELGGNELIVEESKRLQAQLEEVEALFAPGEATVLRVKEDLVIRLDGLSFPTGKSTIETQYFALLKKVQEAIDVFPDSPIVIEGHTDSTGSDAVNMKLSQERATAVREYLVANMGLTESRIGAEGYGETRPVASNETEEGRAQNRRIDVVIKNARARQPQE